jgi:hypothetical protein
VTIANPLTSGRRVPRTVPSIMNNGVVGDRCLRLRDAPVAPPSLFG